MSARVGVKIEKLYLIIFDDRIRWELREKGMRGKLYRVGGIVFGKRKLSNSCSFPYAHRPVRATGIGEQAVKTE